MTATRPSGAALRGHARLRRAGWWAFFLTVALYSAYAAYLGGVEILAMAGLVDGASARALPVAFVVHALTGAVALAAGALQFNRRLRRCCRDSTV